MRWITKRDLPTVSAQRPKTGRWVRPTKLKWRDIHVLHRRGWQGAPIGITDLERRATPKTKVHGSVHERIVHKALLKRRLYFDFQSSLMGGRLMLGGMVADFVLPDRMVIIRVQGTTWHSGFVAMHKDAVQKGILEAYGYTVRDIWDWEIEDPGLLEDWLRDNIDVNVPTRTGAVIAG